MQYDFFFLFGWPTVLGGEPIIDTGDWRIQLQPDSWKRISDKMYVQVLQNSKFFYLYERKGEWQRVN